MRARKREKLYKGTSHHTVKTGPFPHALGEAGSYPVLHEHTPWTGSELVSSLEASLGPNPASPLIRGGAQAQT